MANEKQLIRAIDVYSLFDMNGKKTLHVVDIDSIQRVDAKPVVHGHWRKYSDDKFMGYGADGRIQYRKVYTYECSKCGRNTAVKSNYCPNCGADMRERSEQNGG